MSECECECESVGECESESVSECECESVSECECWWFVAQLTHFDRNKDGLMSLAELRGGYSRIVGVSCAYTYIKNRKQSYQKAVLSVFV